MACPVEAYSVLSHEAVVDTAWDPVIKPLLLKRYPTASEAQLREAHAYAYGGCIIQDMGYYPFGNRLVSDLTHYVRSGAFVDALFQQAQDMYEFAFALGALAHYASDNSGHPLAVNLSVPDIFPKLRRKYGRIVTYENDPVAHITVEFSFDVAQIAASGYTPETYHDFIGFKVSQPLLERAFQQTYGLNFKSLFLSEDLAIGTYRRGASEVIPQMTRVAWKHKKDEILKLNPQMTRRQFEYKLSRRNYQAEWGTSYARSRFGYAGWGGSEAKPGLLASFLVFLARILPKIGPLRTLRFKAPTPQTEAMFLDSFRSTSQRYRAMLAEVPSEASPLQDTDLDTGKPTRAGEYGLTDRTYAKLLDKLADQDFSGVTPPLRANILAFYRDINAPIATKKDSRQWRKVLAELERLKASAATTASLPTVPPVAAASAGSDAIAPAISVAP
jgi:zinc dependent phospholipase C